MTIPEPINYAERKTLSIYYPTIVSEPIRPRIRIVTYTSKDVVLIDEKGSMKMIEPALEMEKWWEDIKPRHFFMSGIGLLFLFLGTFDLILNLFGKTALLYWPSDLLIMFGGLIIFQVALRFAIKHSNL